MLGIIGSMVTQEPGIDMEKMNLPPSNEHLLGTTSFGEDVFAQLSRGIRNSLIVGVLSGGLGTLIAVLLGALGPYKGGLADEISNFVTNVIMVFPVLPMLLFLSYVIYEGNSPFLIFLFGSGRSLFLVGTLIALTSWPWAARCIRSQVLSLKEREFINLARISGMKDRTTVITEVLPNMLAYILVVLVSLAGGGIIAEAGMSAVGVGPNRYQAVTLGNMIYSAMTYHSGVGHWSNIWWWFIPPGLVLTILLSATFAMHAGMDEVFNPRLRRV